MKILIADDEPISRNLLQDTLNKWDYEVIVANDGLEAWQVFETEDYPSLAILDWMMPKMDGIEICKKIRARSDDKYIYIIILTARTKPEDIIMGLEAGADDYITKPFNSDELKYRLKIGERILNLEQRILAVASKDYLTGLLNRRAFINRLEAEINRSKRANKPLGLIFLDLDHFKRINDEYGHRAGDFVIQNVADCLRESCRPYDFLCRYGGEEFIICLPEATVEQSMGVAERIRTAVQNRNILLSDGTNQLKVTASLGVMSTEGKIGRITADQLIDQVDNALYQAKGAGRNKTISFSCN
ncbi:hypothetical protein SYNTR_2283 [Candidatus Syntrophocurvum alkaliphilum]|uniref:Stage 0 sporulation protein A homolog n=1 Tax=Candidatus Syntrophocurvum alkaliphilum TaxID=2293317 RepID=A0A6I6DMD1_9FIRM|nr:diguanylate cyclase [Candidatus Syntrophocurvum alkaliphilum]QGU00877.1 hypothetical protein SYNTR_2283 [Candidatus Syntrophocurvum alkaliphilum]